MPTIRLRMIGRFAILQPPTVQALHLRAKDRALIAYLATKPNKDVKRDELCRLLWPRSETRRSRHSLSQSLHSITKALPGWLATSRTAVRWSNHDIVSDVTVVLEQTELGNLGRVCEILSGRFLDGLITDSREFEDWKTAYEAKFERQVHTNLRNSLTSPEWLKRPAERYEVICKLLHIFPDSEFLTSEKAQLAHSASQTPTKAEGANEGAVTILPFIGRNEEKERLRDLWKSARSAQGGFAVILGGAGQGKSRLIEEFLAEVGGEAKITRVRCYEAERHVGLGPIGDLLRNIATADVLEKVEPIYRHALLELVPEPFDNSFSAPKLSQGGSQRRLFEAVVQVLEHGSRQRATMVTFDDLQWADHSTLALLHMVARRVTESRILIIAAARPAARLRPFLTISETRIIRLRDFTATELESLQADEGLARELRAAPAAFLIKMTGGNAFLLSEIAKNFDAAQKLSDVRRTLSSPNTQTFLRSMLGNLAPNSIRVVSALAVLARPVTENILRRVSGISTLGFARAIDQLRAKKIVIIGDSFSFRHDLIREAVYRRTSAVTRQYLHARAAKVYRDIPGKEGNVAKHLFYARQFKECHLVATVAADIADKRSAINEGTFFLKLAAKTASSPEVRAAINGSLAFRRFKMRQYKRALEHIHAAIHRTNVQMHDGLTLRLMLLELEILMTLGRIRSDDLIVHIEDIQRTHKASIDDEMTYQILRLNLRSAGIEGLADRCASYSQEMYNFAQLVGGALAAKTLSLAARVYSFSVSAIAAKVWAEEAEQLVKTIDDPETKCEILSNVGTVYYEAGELARASAIYDEALRHVRASGALHIWPVAATHKHMVLVECGRFESARDLEKEIRSSWNLEEDSWLFLSTLQANVAVMHWELGDYQACSHHAEICFVYADRFGMFTHKISAWALIGLCQLEMGRLSEANKNAERILRERGVKQPRLGDVSFVEMFLARWNVRYGRVDAAVKSLVDAIEDCKERDVSGYLRMRLELARLTRSRAPRDARTIAEEVKATASNIGAVVIAQHADELLSRIKS